MWGLLPFLHPLFLITSGQITILIHLKSLFKVKFYARIWKTFGDCEDATSTETSSWFPKLLKMSLSHSKLTKHLQALFGGWPNHFFCLIVWQLMYAVVINPKSLHVEVGCFCPLTFPVMCSRNIRWLFYNLNCQQPTHRKIHTLPKDIYVYPF